MTELQVNPRLPLFSGAAKSPLGAPELGAMVAALSGHAYTREQLAEYIIRRWLIWVMTGYDLAEHGRGSLNGLRSQRCRSFQDGE